MDLGLVADCGDPTSYTVAASPALIPIAETWASAFADSCPRTTILVENVSSSALSAQRLCDEENSVEIAAMSRDFLPSEANRLRVPSSGRPRPGYQYQRFCDGGLVFNEIRQVDVAIEALVMITSSVLQNDTAAACIDEMGGLSIPQLRWMYSSYSDEQLNATNGDWNVTEVIPYSDGNSSTRLWSELNPACANEEIVVSGLVSDSLEFDFFSRLVLSDMENGEMIDTTRNATQFLESNEGVAEFVNATRLSIGFVSFKYFLDHEEETKPVPILAVEHEQDNEFLRPWPSVGAVMVPPSLEILQNSEAYALSRRLILNVRFIDARQVGPFMTLVFSEAGQSLVAMHGLVPLSFNDRFIMLSRLGAEGGLPDPFAIRCPGAAGRTDRMFATSQGLAPLTDLFVKVYRDTCLTARTTIYEDTAAGAADRVCRDDDDASDLAMMPRQFAEDEAAVQRNGFAFRCLSENSDGESRTIHEFVVALDAVVLGTAAQGAARNCVGLLGGLSIGQVRWIYSSLSYTELMTEGWDPMAVPNSDGDDSTRLWSELDSRCAAIEINRTILVGEDSEVLDFFSSVALTAEGESANLSGVTLTSGSTTSVETGGIVFLAYSTFQRAQLDLRLVGVRDTSFFPVFPREGTIQDRSYGSFVRPIFMNTRIGGGALNWLTLEGFVDTILSPDGGIMVGHWGYVHLSDEELAEMQGRREVVRSRLFCFSSQNRVDVRGKGKVPIGDIEIGDYVLSGSGTYERVYSFGHYEKREEANFLQIRVEEGVAVELTGDHMMVVNGVIDLASSIKIGDFLSLVDGGRAMVTGVVAVKRNGVFAPFTESGMITVNGYVASCYAHVGRMKSNSLRLGSVDTTTYQLLAHLAQTPHRLVCVAHFEWCQSEVYDDEGLTLWVSHQLVAFHWLDNGPPAISTLVVLWLVLLSMMLSLLEVILKNAFLCIAVALLAIVPHICASKHKKVI